MLGSERIVLYLHEPTLKKCNSIRKNLRKLDCKTNKSPSTLINLCNIVTAQLLGIFLDKELIADVIGSRCSTFWVTFEELEMFSPLWCQDGFVSGRPLCPITCAPKHTGRLRLMSKYTGETGTLNAAWNPCPPLSCLNR